MVERAGERWGLGDEEVRRRRGFVERIRGEVAVSRAGGAVDQRR